jgi:hypothetical protein
MSGRSAEPPPGPTRMNEVAWREVAVSHCARSCLAETLWMHGLILSPLQPEMRRHGVDDLLHHGGEVCVEVSGFTIGHRVTEQG